MATHLEDFLELSCGELQFYLKQRGLPSGGTHSDLAARALVAFEHKTPIRDSAESQAKSLQNEHVELLRTCGIKDPLSMVDWEDCVTKWPHTNIGQIFSFILGKKAFDTDYIGQSKIGFFTLDSARRPSRVESAVVTRVQFKFGTSIWFALGKDSWMK